nr:cryptochrome/photolyase family protein [Kordiimonas gwangyangensis]
MKPRNLLVIFGDQLSMDMASLKAADPAQDHVLMVEVAAEAETVNHHKQKLVFFFAAMRHFRDELRAAGWSVDYVTLDAPENTGTFEGEIARAVERLSPDRLVFTAPSEWRVERMVGTLENALDIPVKTLEDTRFLCGRNEFAAWAEGRRGLRMEYFYREMRRKTGLLMNDDKPEGGRWNFDAENRKPAGTDLFMPRPPRIKPDQTTADVITMVGETFDTHCGKLKGFGYAVTRADAEKCLDYFISHALPLFGDYQDAC